MIIILSKKTKEGVNDIERCKQKQTICMHFMQYPRNFIQNRSYNARLSPHSLNSSVCPGERCGGVWKNAKRSRQRGKWYIIQIESLHFPEIPDDFYYIIISLKESTNTENNKRQPRAVTSFVFLPITNKRMGELGYTSFIEKTNRHSLFTGL